MMPMHSVSPVPEPASAPHQDSRRGTAVMVAALLALAGLVTWWWLRDDAREVPVAPQAAQPTDTVTLADGAPQWAYLELAVAEAQPAITPSPAPGRVAFDEKRSAAVTSPLPGRVDEVRVRLGDQVKAGDKLVAVRSGALADLDRELESARSQVAAKTRVADRARELVGMRAAPEKDLLEAEEDLREAQLALKAAIAKRDSLNATIEGDTRFWITARQDGTVVEFDVAAGQQVGPDHDRPLLRLSHIDKVLVLTDLQEQDAYDVRVDTPATVRTAGGGVTRPGVVEYVSQVVDPQRRTVELRVRVDNADGLLRPNAFVEVALTPDPTQRRVRVASEAVVSDGEESVVFVTREAGRLERTPITVGRRGGGEVELRSGLEPGTRYVAKGALLLLNQLQLAQ